MNQMNWSLWWAQIRSVIRLEMRKTFFAKRGIWVYLLALAPAALFFADSIAVIHDRDRRVELETTHPINSEAIGKIEMGDSRESVETKLGTPYSQQTFKFGGRRERHEQVVDRYTDGENDYAFIFRDDELVGRRTNERRSIPKDSLIFASVFQFFYLRLAIFFGCVGIFTNLFRGELLDKSLHFYLLAPIRREVLLVGEVSGRTDRHGRHFHNQYGASDPGGGLASDGSGDDGVFARPRLGTNRRLPGRHGDGMPGIWQRLPGRGTPIPQSDHPRCRSAVVGECESVSSSGVEENQRDLLFAVDVPGGGKTERHAGVGGVADVLGRSDSRDLGCERTHRRHVGSVGSCRPTGSEARDQLQLRLVHRLQSGFNIAIVAFVRLAKIVKLLDVPVAAELVEDSSVGNRGFDGGQRAERTRV